MVTCLAAKFVPLFANGVPLVYNISSGFSLGYFILLKLTSVNLRFT